MAGPDVTSGCRRQNCGKAVAPVIAVSEGNQYSSPIFRIWVTHMKTTIEINDELFARSRRAAKREGKTLRALMEEGLRLALQARSAKPAPDFDYPVFGSGGLRDEVQGKGWDALRDTIYETSNRRAP